MRVLLDANIYLADMALRKPAFVTLLDSLEAAGHQLIVPVLVFEEVVNRYAEEYDKLLGMRGKLGFGSEGPMLDSPCPTLEDARERYRQFLRERLGVAKGVGYPTTSHSELVGRALARRKPFRNTDGGGYRDALIWETIVELACDVADSPVAFVSANLRDFSEGGKAAKLHRDLEHDLRSRGKRTSEVRLFGKLEEFNEAHVTPILKLLKDMPGQLADGTFPDLNLERFLQEELTNHVGGVELEPQGLGFPHEFETSYLSTIEEVEEISCAEVRALPSGMLLVSFVAEADCEFEVFIAKADYYVLAEDEAPYVSDYDWNDWCVRAWASSRVEMEIDLIFDGEARRVKSASIRETRPLVEWWERRDRG